MKNPSKVSQYWEYTILLSFGVLYAFIYYYDSSQNNVIWKLRRHEYTSYGNMFVGDVDIVTNAINPYRKCTSYAKETIPESNGKKTNTNQHNKKVQKTSIPI